MLLALLLAPVLSEYQSNVISVWRHGSDLFLARPDGKPEERIGAGRNAAVALNQAGAFLVWSTSDGVIAKAPGQSAPRVLSRTGAFPSIASQGKIVIAVWEDDGKIRTERLD